MSLCFCNKTAPMALLEASDLTINSLFKSGMAKIGLLSNMVIEFNFLKSIHRRIFPSGFEIWQFWDSCKAIYAPLPSLFIFTLFFFFIHL